MSTPQPRQCLCHASTLSGLTFLVLTFDFDFLQCWSLTVDFDQTQSWLGVFSSIFRPHFKFVVCFFCFRHLYMVQNEIFYIKVFVLCGLSRFMHYSIRFHSLFRRSSTRFNLLAVGTLRSNQSFLWSMSFRVTTQSYIEKMRRSSYKVGGL